MNCGVMFRPLRAGSRYCSRPCAWANNGGHNRKQETWWIGQKGYVIGRIWEGESQRNVRQHVVVMERHIGRRLLPNEDVHHLNGNKQDNRIENLALMTKAEHSRLHNARRNYQSGYKLQLSDDERAARSRRMREMRAAQHG